MKTLFIKFRLSSALDENACEPISDSLREKLNASPELQEFAQRTAALDRRLRHPPAVPPTDATLHESIMRAVRASAVESTSSHARIKFGTRGSSSLPIGLPPAFREAGRGERRESLNAPMRFGLAMAFAAFAVIAIWLTVRPTAQVVPTAASNAQTMAAAQLVLDMSGEISRTVPASVVAPLSNELACVDHDIRDTTQFVLAVLP